MRGYKKLLFFSACSVMLCINLVHAARPIEGRVVMAGSHKNRNPGDGKGLARIPVSNGDTIVMTDRHGRFTIMAETGQSIFPVLPAGYRMSAQGVANSAFRHIGEDYRDVQGIVFLLDKRDISKTVRVAAIGDIQVKNVNELSYARRTVLSEIADRGDIDLSIFMGDLVNDNMELMETVRAELGVLPGEKWTVPGNHDRDMADPRNFETYGRLFGAQDYAFHYGDVLFVCLNNVRTRKKNDYDGYVSATQLRFLENLLKITPEKKMLVLNMHIPLAGTQNKEQVIASLGERKVLVLTGHTHRVGKVVHSPLICEQGVGAACGSWWVGERDYDAVPAALQQDGSPRNYFLVDINGSEYTLTYKGVGLDASNRVHVWIAGDEVIDSQLRDFSGFGENTVVANVYAGCYSTKVFMSIDEGEYIPMTRSEVTAPTVARIKSWNSTAGYPSAHSRKIPFRNSVSPHIWIAEMPADISKGPHTLKIIAWDDYGLNVSVSKVIDVK